MREERIGAFLMPQWIIYCVSSPAAFDQFEHSKRVVLVSGHLDKAIQASLDQRG